MGNMREIACKHCGGPISLNEEWDRTSDDFRSSEWTTHNCAICGGSMTFYRRWVDPPKAHTECTDAGWHDAPCSICFGPMSISPGFDPTAKFHPRCAPENWYERTCEACDQPLRIHVDWDDVPTVHRQCETQEWYEKQCKYCNATLKVHVDWERAPDSHDECKPAPTADVPVTAPPTMIPGPGPEIVLAPVSVVDAGSEIVDSVSTNGSREIALYNEPESESGIAIDTDYIQIVSVESSVDPSETNTKIEVEPGPEILIERNGSVERDAEITDTPWANFNEEMTELTQPREYPLENENRHEYSCPECGEHIVRLDGTLPEPRSLCQNCKHDALLLSGAVAALRKRFEGDLNVAVETRTRTITEKIAVVSTVESDEVVAEIKLCDDGVFSNERVALAYDPETQERFSKTVFGKKGLFSSLRTTDTFDCEGKLLEHIRSGKELPLSADNDRDEAHAVRITNNRFFLKRK